LKGGNILDKNLMSAVEERNVLHIKSALTSITLKDRNFSTGEFDEGLRYVESKNIAGLYDDFDGEELKPESEWNQDYWTYINVSLVDNFCKERIDLLKKIGRKIYPVQQKTVTPPTGSPVQKKNQQSTSNKYPSTNQTSGRSRRTKSAGLPLSLKAAGAVVATGAGFLVGGPAVGISVAVLAGGAIAWTNKNK